MSEARRSTFRALLGCYHNSFANVKEGRVAHSPEFIRTVLGVCEAQKVRALLATDPRLTSTDEGAIAVGIARAVMVSEKASRSFIDVEINEGGTFVVTFDKDLKPDYAAQIVAPTGAAAVLCKPDDKLGEGMTADCTLILVEPTQQVAESFVKAEKDLIAEGFKDVAKKVAVGAAVVATLAGAAGAAAHKSHGEPAPANASAPENTNSLANWRKNLKTGGKFYVSPEAAAKANEAKKATFRVSAPGSHKASSPSAAPATAGKHKVIEYVAPGTEVDDKEEDEVGDHHSTLLAAHYKNVADTWNTFGQHAHPHEWREWLSKNPEPTREQAATDLRTKKPGAPAATPTLAAPGDTFDAEHGFTTKPRHANEATSSNFHKTISDLNNSPAGDDPKWALDKTQRGVLEPAIQRHNEYGNLLTKVADSHPDASNHPAVINAMRAYTNAAMSIYGKKPVETHLSLDAVYRNLTAFRPLGSVVASADPVPANLTELSAADVKSLYSFVYGEKSFNTVGEAAARKALVALVTESKAAVEKIVGEALVIPADIKASDLAADLIESLGEKLPQVVALMAFDPQVKVAPGQLQESFEDDLRKSLLVSRTAQNMMFAAGIAPSMDLTESFSRLVAFIKKQTAPVAPVPA